jgi:hypothetical protein
MNTGNLLTQLAETYRFVIVLYVYKFKIRFENLIFDTSKNLNFFILSFQLELSSIRPELTPTFKTEDTKLGEEELNILMAHAYWKIITLQKELAKQQVNYYLD